MRFLLHSLFYIHCSCNGSCTLQTNKTNKHTQKPHNQKNPQSSHLHPKQTTEPPKKSRGCSLWSGRISSLSFVWLGCVLRSRGAFQTLGLLALSCIAVLHLENRNICKGWRLSEQRFIFFMQNKSQWLRANLHFCMGMQVQCVWARSVLGLGSRADFVQRRILWNSPVFTDFAACAICKSQLTFDIRGDSWKSENVTVCSPREPHFGGKHHVDDRPGVELAEASVMARPRRGTYHYLKCKSLSLLLV